MDSIINKTRRDVQRRLKRVQKIQQTACLSFIQIGYSKESRISLFRGL